MSRVPTIADQIETNAVASSVFSAISYAGWKLRYTHSRIRLSDPTGQRWPDLRGFDQAKAFALGFWASSVPGIYPDGRPTPAPPTPGRGMAEGGADAVPG